MRKRENNLLPLVIVDIGFSLCYDIRVGAVKRRSLFFFAAKTRLFRAKKLGADRPTK